MNLGLRDALSRSPDHIPTVNDDVTFESGLPDALVACAERHRRRLVSSFITRDEQPEKIWYARGEAGWLRGELLHRRLSTDGQLRWLTGMGAQIPAAVFSEVGRYDEQHFPQYVADGDLSLRALERVVRLAVELLSRIWNKTEESTHVIDCRLVTPGTFFLLFRSIRSSYQLGMRLALYRGHWPAWIRPLVVAVLMLTSVITGNRPQIVTTFNCSDRLPLAGPTRSLQG